MIGIFLDATDYIKGELKDLNALHLTPIILHKVSTTIQIRVGNHLRRRILPWVLRSDT